MSRLCHDCVTTVSRLCDNHITAVPRLFHDFHDYVTTVSRLCHECFTTVPRQSEYWDKKISNCQGDPKKLWRSLSSVLRKEKPKLPDSEELSAERFSEAFQAKLDRVRSATAAAPPPTFEGPCCLSNLEDFKLLDDAAVRRFISSAACKFCELDPAPTWIIKKYANELSPFIVKLFNTSLTTDQWCISNFPELCPCDSSSQEGDSGSV